MLIEIQSLYKAESKLINNIHHIAIVKVRSEICVYIY